MTKSYLSLDLDDDVIFDSTGLVQTLRTPHAASVWKSSLASNLGPETRSSHFTVAFENKVVIGYGFSRHNSPMNDVWQLDLETKRWCRINIEQSAKTGTKAVLVGKDIYVFGGFANQKYFSDLHSLSLNDYSVRTFEDIQHPAGRIGHVFSEFEGKVFLWGGFNGTFLNDAWIFLTSERKWIQIPTQMNGPLSASYCQLGSKVYVFGGTRKHKLTVFDFKTRKFEFVSTTGEKPEEYLVGAGLVAIGNRLVLVGGQLSNSSYCYVYTLDLSENRWTKLPLLPDFHSKHIHDGDVDSKGDFKIPRVYHSSLIYHPKSNSIVYFFGEPKEDLPSIYFIELDDILSSL